MKSPPEKKNQVGEEKRGTVHRSIDSIFIRSCSVLHRFPLFSQVDCSEVSNCANCAEEPPILDDYIVQGVSLRTLVNGARLMVSK